MKALWVLMVLFAVAFAAWMVLDIDRSKDLDPRDYSFSVSQGDDGMLRVLFVKGDPMPLDQVTATLDVDGTRHTVAGSEMGLGDPWTAGQRACLVGPACPIPDGREVSLTLRLDDVVLVRAQRTLA